jgi:hypothetical protein
MVIKGSTKYLANVHDGSRVRTSEDPASHTVTALDISPLRNRPLEKFSSFRRADLWNLREGFTRSQSRVSVVAAPGGMKRVDFNSAFLATVKEFSIPPMRLTPGLKLLVAVELIPVAEYREHRQVKSCKTPPLANALPQPLPRSLP